MLPFYRCMRVWPVGVWDVAFLVCGKLFRWKPRSCISFQQSACISKQCSGLCVGAMGVSTWEGAVKAAAAAMLGFRPNNWLLWPFTYQLWCLYGQVWPQKSVKDVSRNNTTGNKGWIEKHGKNCETALLAKKGCIERKALLKERLYWKKGFLVEKIQMVKYLSNLSEMFKLSALSYIVL